MDGGYKWVKQITSWLFTVPRLGIQHTIGERLHALTTDHPCMGSLAGLYDNIKKPALQTET